MKDKSWIIILIMGIALTISIGYSIVVSQRNKNGESTVTTTSIIEMRATTVTIKNTLAATGNVEYRVKQKENNEQQNEEQQNIQLDNIEQENIEEKTFQITLSVEDKDLKKVKVDQDVEVTIKNENETLYYQAKVIKVKEDINNKSTFDIEILNPDEKLHENMSANCKVIVEKAENVVALPIEAIQKNGQNEEFVDVIQEDGSTKECNISTGVSDDYYVEITQGLNVGDRVQIVKSSTTIVEKENQTSEK